MKKKILTLLLIATMIFGINWVTVSAANGPSGKDSYVAIYNPSTTESKYVVEILTVHNDLVEGVTYDKATNTLTIKNLKTTAQIVANEMGDDFKINVVGDNEIGMIIGYGFEYGGTINIVGDGTLTVNKDKTNSYAVVLEAEASNAKFIVSNTATVKLYAKDKVIGIYYTKAKNGVVLKNGQDISTILKSEDAKTIQKSNGFTIGMGGDEYKIATKDGKKYAYDSATHKLYKEEVVCIGEGVSEVCFFDLSNTLLGKTSTTYTNDAEVEADGYTITNTTKDVATPVFLNGYDTYTNGGKTYLYFGDIYEILGEANLVGGKYYFIQETTAIAYEDLDPVLVTADYYNHEVNAKELIIEAKEVEETKVTADDTKSDNDKNAAGAVNKLLEDAANGKETPGMSQELIDAINQAIEQGDTVEAELAAEMIEESNVSDAVKEEVKNQLEEAKDLKGSTVLGFFDINLFIKINDERLADKVTELSDEIEVEIDVTDLVKDLPAVEKGKVREFKIIAIHDGKVSILDATLDSNNILRFKTNKFSDYIVTYNEVKNPKTSDNIVSFLCLGAISMVGAIVISLYLRKNNA